MDMANDNVECPICFELKDKLIHPNTCDHGSCVTCAGKWARAHAGHTFTAACPQCRSTNIYQGPMTQIKSLGVLSRITPSVISQLNEISQLLGEVNNNQNIRDIIISYLGSNEDLRDYIINSPEGHSWLLVYI